MANVQRVDGSKRAAACEVAPLAVWTQVIADGDEQQPVGLEIFQQRDKRDRHRLVMFVVRIAQRLNGGALDQHLWRIHDSASLAWVARFARTLRSRQLQNQNAPPAIAQPTRPSITQCSPR